MFTHYKITSKTFKY